MLHLLEGVFDLASVLDFLTSTGRTTSLASPLDMSARVHLSSGPTKRIQSEPGIRLLHTHASISIVVRPSNTGISQPFYTTFLSSSS